MGKALGHLVDLSMVVNKMWKLSQDGSRSKMLIFIIHQGEWHIRNGNTAIGVDM